MGYADDRWTGHCARRIGGKERARLKQNTCDQKNKEKTIRAFHAPHSAGERQECQGPETEAQDWGSGYGIAGSLWLGVLPGRKPC